MKNNFFLFHFVILVVIYTSMCLGFYLLAILIKIGDLSNIFILEIFAFPAISIVIMISCINLPSYLLKVVDDGVKPFLRETLNWSDISVIKVHGIPNSYRIKQVTFESNGRKIVMKLFPYKQPKELCELIKKKLPWASNIDFAKALSECKKEN